VRRGLLTAVALNAIGASALLSAQPPERAGKPLPSVAKVQETVTQYFAGLPDYQEGQLIVRSEAQGALLRLERLGWKVPQSAELLAKVPEEGELLATELRSPEGKKFMSKSAKFPLSYDRIDRLIRLPHGPQTLHDLIRGPDGYKMIEYMTTASGGREMGKMLSKARGGADFNQPTGRIYTAAALLDHLKKAHSAATKPPAKPQKGRPWGP